MSLLNEHEAWLISKTLLIDRRGDENIIASYGGDAYRTFRLSTSKPRITTWKLEHAVFLLRVFWFPSHPEQTFCLLKCKIKVKVFSSLSKSSTRKSKSFNVEKYLLYLKRQRRSRSKWEKHSTQSKGRSTPNTESRKRNSFNSYHLEGKQKKLPK